MRVNVFAKALRDMRWQVFWYGFGFAVMAALVVYIYPSYKGQLADFQMPEAFQAFLGENADYSSPKGFLSGEVFSWIPIMLVIFAIMQGTNLIGGEEASGTMDILLAQPVSRRKVILEKMAAFVGGGLGIVLITCVGWVLSLPFVDISISFGSVVLATFNMLPLALAFGCMSLWLSVALPGRQQATGIATAVAVASFIVNYLATLVDVMKPFRLASMFYYSNTTAVLTSGVDWPKLAVLAALTLAFAVLAVRSFERRDIGVQAAAGWRLTFRRRAEASAA